MPKFSVPPKSALIAALVVAVPAVLVHLAPTESHAVSFAAFGALGLFLGARGGAAGAALALGAKLLADLAQYAARGYDADYLPMPSVYASLALYALVGALAVGRTGSNPWRVGGSALIGSVLFFLASNAFAWGGQALPYQRTFAGLMDAYAMGLEFFRPALVRDLGYTALLFGMEWAVVRATAAKPVVATEDAR